MAGHSSVAAPPLPGERRPVTEASCGAGMLTKPRRRWVRRAGPGGPAGRRLLSWGTVWTSGVDILAAPDSVPATPTPQPRDLSSSTPPRGASPEARPARFPTRRRRRRATRRGRDVRLPACWLTRTGAATTATAPPLYGESQVSPGPYELRPWLWRQNPGPDGTLENDWTTRTQSLIRAPRLRRTLF